ncbi:S-layer homology domain-containing protein [Paenibacillus sp. sgz500958]|uniref:S-layer homology domain-containing protein n=1 Tax=Paenibacillus sp. sgz500958 TaxID=3242475 RepID=UPI0036D36952
MIKVIHKPDAPFGFRCKSLLLLMAGILLLTSLIGSSAVSGASAVRNTDKAIALQGMQLFRGSSLGYELDKGFTRAQGSVMLLRLLGWEDEALSYGGKTSFTDLKATHWAAPSIAYASSKGLVKGMTANTFAPDAAMSGRQFIALTLRALGYANADPANALTLAEASGLLTFDEIAKLGGTQIFLRDDMVGVAYNALSTKLNGSSQTLLQKLVDEDHAVTREAALASGLYKEAAKAVTSGDPLDVIESAIRDALHK